jgi:hypothetical protein
VRRQFPQFPHGVLPVADHGIGPIREEHETILRARGLRRPGILAHRYKGPERGFPPFPPVIWPWTSRLRAPRVVQAADDDRGRAFRSVDVDEHHAEPFSTKVG